MAVLSSLKTPSGRRQAWRCTSRGLAKAVRLRRCWNRIELSWSSRRCGGSLWGSTKMSATNEWRARIKVTFYVCYTRFEGPTIGVRPSNDCRRVVHPSPDGWPTGRWPGVRPSTTLRNVSDTQRASADGLNTPIYTGVCVCGPRSEGRCLCGPLSSPVTLAGVTAVPCVGFYGRSHTNANFGESIMESTYLVRRVAANWQITSCRTALRNGTRGSDQWSDGGRCTDLPLSVALLGCQLNRTMPRGAFWIDLLVLSSVHVVPIAVHAMRVPDSEVSQITKFTHLL